ncbi:hypothetical protein K439DRAFT_1656501 [Ramaria rubella]|nr:hypothetical protein K439DRAFT_1656501 [Ramaria rubella]
MQASYGQLDKYRFENANEGRPLKQLVQSFEPLKGAESQQLRSFFSSNRMEPARDLDAYGKLLINGNLDDLKNDFERRKDKNIVAFGNAHTIAINQLYAIRWGPTQVPIFNCLLLATIIWPQRRQKILDVVCWLISLGVLVDGRDLSGTTALAHSLSTKPSLDTEFAKLLLDAGGDINKRNRYGATCAHEFSMVRTPDPVLIDRAGKALRFFLSHGGDPNIADNDGITAMSVMRIPWLSSLKEIALEEEALRRKEGCAFCGSRMGDKNAVQLMKCGRCKKVRYCGPPKGCQRADWTGHKRECNA